MNDLEFPFDSKALILYDILIMSSESEVEKPEINQEQAPQAERAAPQDKLHKIFRDVTRSFSRARSDLKEHFVTKMILEK